MHRFHTALRKGSILLTSLIAGICIFTALASFRVDSTLFNLQFHKELFNKYDIYTHVRNIADSSLNLYESNLKPASPDSLEQQKQLFSLVGKALTPEMIKLNLNSFLDGILNYFRSETRFLPDIYLNPVQGKSPRELQTSKQEDDSITEESLAKIDKINLSVILMYLNRDDITNKLSEVRLAHFFLAKLPGFLFILLITCFLAAVLLIRRKARIAEWLSTAAMTAGLLNLTGGVFLFVYASRFLPQNTAFLAMSVPLPGNVTIEYMRSCIYPIAIYFVAAGIILAVISLIVRFFPGWIRKTGLYRRFESSSFLAGRDIRRQNAGMIRKHGKTALLLILILVAASITILKIESTTSDFHAKDLTVVLDRLKGINASTEVIPAMNETVYTYELRLVDVKSNLPIPGVHVNINGKSYPKGISFNDERVTDETGISRFTLDKGYYKLSFTPDLFPETYKMPSPLFFEMKTAGTTITTVNLYPAEGEKPGIAEIEVLGGDNKPISGIELAIEGSSPSPTPENPARTFSITNADGIAVFNVDEGDYIVKTDELKLPAQYLAPQSININVLSDSVSRYTIKLAARSVPQKTKSAKRR